MRLFDKDWVLGILPSFQIICQCQIIWDYFAAGKMWNLTGENAGDLQGGDATLLQENPAHPLQIHLQCSSRARKVFEKGGAKAQQMIFSKTSLSVSSANDPTSHFPEIFALQFFFLKYDPTSHFQSCFPSNFPFWKFIEIQFSQSFLSPIFLFEIFQKSHCHVVYSMHDLGWSERGE